MSDEIARGPGAARRLPWRELYEALAGEMLGYLWRVTGDREVATELLQDTFLAGMRDEAQLRDPDRARAWLYRIATHLATRRLRRTRLIRFLPFSGHERFDDGRTDVERIAVREALHAIPPEQAAALVLHYAHGFTRSEIAGMTGRTEEGVKSRIARGKRAFLAAYDRHGRER